MSAFTDMAPIEIFMVVLIVSLSIWLFVRRIRGCFAFHKPEASREMALFMAAPFGTLLTAVLMFTARINAGREEGLDALETILSAGASITMLVLVGLLSFILGIVAMLLPQASPGAKASEPAIQ